MADTSEHATSSHASSSHARSSHAAASRTFRHAVVTGGAGFVGGHLCEALLDRGVTVTCVDDFSSGSPANVAHLDDARLDDARPAGHARFHLVEADLTRPGALDAVPTDVDLVLHLASPASPVAYLSRPVETLQVASLGTQQALDLARAAGARFLLASTSEVYGDPAVHPQREDYWGNVNPIGPRSVYDEGKRYAEALTTAYRGACGTDTAIARIFNTYGPRMRADDGRMIPAFVMQALAGEPLTVAGDGSQTRSVCYVDDLVRGLLALADSDLPGPVNLGSSTELTVAQIAADVLAETGSSSTTVFVDLPEDDPRRRRPDTSLARSALGWRATTDWPTGLGRTVAWFRDTLAGTGQLTGAGRPGAGRAGAGDGLGE
ncbi:NAD-dependent epimerase/dehydratase family protein [Sanguibacter suarezii]|uniref:NAD-dependent epimerase/dehydratase family protein n=1 Tax=Sanguibacter suarezii TaxID=60921 RepID=UPI0009FCE0F8|nr:NAD-dependent epimerase/dehydratase family protein [Sanguibacter suarezii]